MPVNEPNRPGLNSPPTAPQTNPAVAFASRLVASKARFVVILELHDMPYAEDFALEEARDILVQGNRRKYFSEHPIDTSIFFSKIIRNLRTRGTTAKIAPHRFEIVQRQNDDHFSAIPIGFELVVYDELFSKLPHILTDRERKLFSDFILEPYKKLAARRYGQTVPDSIAMRDFFIDANFKKGQGEITFLNMQAPGMALAIRKCERAGQNFLDVINEVEKLSNKIEEALLKLRVEGQSDEMSAKKLFEHLAPNELGIAKYGIMHGIIAGNPASLPDQLQRIAAEKGQNDSVEILALVSKDCAPDIHRRIGLQYRGGTLRKNVTVWDYELQSEWPILDWYRNAHHIYAGKTTIPIPAISP